MFSIHLIFSLEGVYMGCLDMHVQDMHVSDLHVLFCLHNMSLSCKFLFPTIIVLNKVVQKWKMKFVLIIIASAALRIRRD